MERRTFLKSLVGTVAVALLPRIGIAGCEVEEIAAPSARELAYKFKIVEVSGMGGLPLDESPRIQVLARLVCDPDISVYCEISAPQHEGESSVREAMKKRVVPMIQGAFHRQLAARDG